MANKPRYGSTRFDAAVKSVEESNPRWSKKENLITETKTNLIQSIQAQIKITEKTQKQTQQKIVATELWNVNNMTPEEFETRMNSD